MRCPDTVRRSMAAKKYFPSKVAPGAPGAPRERGRRLRRDRPARLARRSTGPRTSTRWRSTGSRVNYVDIGERRHRPADRVRPRPRRPVAELAREHPAVRPGAARGGDRPARLRLLRDASPRQISDRAATGGWWPSCAGGSDLAPAVLVGNSMGGFVAAEVPIRTPETRRAPDAGGLGRASRRWTCAEAPGAGHGEGGGPAGHRQRRADARAPPCGRACVTGRCRWWPAIPAGSRPTRLFEGMMKGADKPGFEPALRANLDYDFRDRLPEIGCPMLVVWGEKDMIIPVSRRRHLRRAHPGRTQGRDGGHGPRADGGAARAPSTTCWPSSSPTRCPRASSSPPAAPPSGSGERAPSAGERALGWPSPRGGRTWPARPTCSAAPAARRRPPAPRSPRRGRSTLSSRASTSKVISVAVAHRRDRSAARRLGRHVAGHETVRGAGEAAVGEQRHGVAQALALQRGGDREHLAHARPAGRALVADDHHLAGVDRAGLDRGEGVLLALEHPRRALVHRGGRGRPA